MSLARSCDKIKYFFFTITMHMATRVGRMVTYLEELLHITSHNPSITRYCEFTIPNKASIDTKRYQQIANMTGGDLM